MYMDFQYLYQHQRQRVYNFLLFEYTNCSTPTGRQETHQAEQEVVVVDRRHSLASSGRRQQFKASSQVRVKWSLAKIGFQETSNSFSTNM